MAKTIGKEIFNKNSEKFDFSIDKKILKAVTGLAVLSLAAYGVYDLATDEKETTPTPTEKTEITATSTGTEVKVPSEAKDFVEKYGNNYNDPVAVYYAEDAYQKKYKPAVIDKEFISNYDYLRGSSSKDSILGFKSYSINYEANEYKYITPQATAKVFNEYISVNIERYMNLLAKNPKPDAIKVIDRQFQDYCSDTVGHLLAKPEFTDDDKNIKKLMDTLKSVVAKNKNSVNYSVVKAEVASNDLNKTSVDSSVGVSGKNTDVITQELNRLVIEIEEYDNKKEVIRKKEVIKDIRLTIMRQPNSSNVSLGQDETIEY